MAEEFAPGSPDFEAGSQIASYQLAGEIGRGGMAVVYRARDVRLGRWVALKVLAPEYARDQAFRQRFIRESRAAAAVDHPNIIPIFDAGEADGVLYIAMRYVTGQDVHSLLRRAGPLPAARAVGIVTQVAAALDAAHACGLVHRDVKPANMLLGGQAESGTPDHVYLSDFGISKASYATTSLTLTGQVLGTLNYLAPEQVEGRTVNGRADEYALACTAFELLAGTPPFQRDENLAVLWDQVSAPPPPLTSRRPDLPPAVDQVLAKALAKSPDDRYQTCQGLAAALRAACQAAPSAARPGTVVAAPACWPAPPTAADAPATPVQEPATRAAGPAPAPAAPARPAGALPSLGPSGTSLPPGPPPRPARRRRWPAVLAVCAVLLALAGVGAVLRQHRETPPTAATSSSPATRRSTAPSAVPSPAGTVRAYYAAISQQNYQGAWNLGGKNTGATFDQFKAGFAGTERDQVTELSAAGNTVTAQFTAYQTDGSQKTYAGTYLVRRGVIVRFAVRQTG